MNTVVASEASSLEENVPCSADDCAAGLSPHRLLEFVCATVALAAVGRRREPGAPVLAVLVYAYARGLYASADIAWLSATDPELRVLTGGEAVSVGTLRWWRRAARGALVECLGRVIEHAGGRHPRDEALRRCGEAVRADAMEADG